MSESDKPEENETQPPTPEEVAEQGGRGEPQDPNGPVNTDYQDTDIHLDTVKKFVIGSFAVVFVVFGLMLIANVFYERGFEEERGVATPEERQIPGKDDALLQTKPLEDLAEYKAVEEERMTTKTNAVAHAVIPVEDAKQLMVQEGFPHSQVAQPGEETMPVDMAEAAHGEPKAVAKPEPKAEPKEVIVATAPAPTLDPAMVAAGKKIWETQCMAACHTGKRGAIAPNIQKAYGSMRKLEGGGEILMDTAYIINSMNHPNEHVAKGYMPVMMSFENVLTDLQKEQVAMYLQSQGKPIPVAAPEPVEVAKPVEPQPLPVAEPATEPVVPKPIPMPEPAPAPVQPAPVPQPQPVVPTPEPEAPAGTIFV